MIDGLLSDITKLNWAAKVGACSGFIIIAMVIIIWSRSLRDTGVMSQIAHLSLRLKWIIVLGVSLLSLSIIFGASDSTTSILLNPKSICRLSKITENETSDIDFIVTLVTPDGKETYFPVQASEKRYGGYSDRMAPPELIIDKRLDRDVPVDIRLELRHKQAESGSYEFHYYACMPLRLGDLIESGCILRSKNGPDDGRNLIVTDRKGEILLEVVPASDRSELTGC